MPTEASSVEPSPDDGAPPRDPAAGVGRALTGRIGLLLVVTAMTLAGLIPLSFVAALSALACAVGFVEMRAVRSSISDLGRAAPSGASPS